MTRDFAESASPPGPSWRLLCELHDLAVVSAPVDVRCVGGELGGVHLPGGDHGRYGRVGGRCAKHERRLLDVVVGRLAKEDLIAADNEPANRVEVRDVHEPGKRAVLALVHALVVDVLPVDPDYV